MYGAMINPVPIGSTLSSRMPTIRSATSVRGLLIDVYERLAPSDSLHLRHFSIILLASGARAQVAGLSGRAGRRRPSELAPPFLQRSLRFSRDIFPVSISTR